MTTDRVFRFKRLTVAVGAMVLGAMLAAGPLASAHAQSRQTQSSEADPESRVLTARSGETVQQALTLLEEERFAEVVAELTPLLDDALNAYERFVVYQLRGRARFGLDDLDGTIADFTAMLETGAATHDEANTARVQLGQLHIATDNLDQGLAYLEAAVANEVELNQGFLSLLSRAYYRAERYRDGLEYAELYYRRQATRSQADYTLMQAYYKQLDQTENEMDVIEAALADFPEARINWQNLVAILARLERENDAFEANKLMYLNGLFENCDELFRLAQYYSHYENPYRGATLLEREINTGRCDGDVEQLRTLANMWRQAREFDRAIPVLERLASQTGEGNWYAKLAEAHFELHNLPAAETAFEDALEAGGLDQPGTVWGLLGTVRFQQGDLISARAAFRQAASFDGERGEARAWLTYLESRINHTPMPTEVIQFEECRLIVANELEIATIVGQADENGRVRLQVPEYCWPYYDDFGEQIGTVEAPSDVTGRTGRAPT